MIHQYYPSVNHNYKYELNKDMNFSAAHYIPHEDAGKCANMHGHTYVVNLTIVGDELDHLGFLVNFSDLKRLVHGRFDHGVINHTILTPTTENVARYIYNLVNNYLEAKDNNPKCIQVIVRETPTSYVVYRGDTK